jgi:hypothetical protein
MAKSLTLLNLTCAWYIIPVSLFYWTKLLHRFSNTLQAMIHRGALAAILRDILLLILLNKYFSSKIFAQMITGVNCLLIQKESDPLHTTGTYAGNYRALMWSSYNYGDCSSQRPANIMAQAATNVSVGVCPSHMEQ